MKSPSILRRVLLPMVCSLGIAVLMSCGITEPKDSALKANTPPDTRITSGPKEGSTFSYSVRISWVGEDNDGIISGYNLVVDGNTAFVTASDSTFAFSAANQDEAHSIAVAAVDDKGAADATPATLTFTATNSAPNTALVIAGDPAPGATFGRGAIFIIAGEDVDNGPGFSYRFNIDNGPWSDWLTNPVIEFSSTSPFGLLPEGQHTFFAQVRDAGAAIDPTPAEFPLVVSAAVKPGVTLNALQNQKPFYEDNSAFAFPAGTSVQFSWAAVFDYAGGASTGSRYRIDGGAWTDYSTAVSALELTSVAAGAHTFEVEFRDLAGTLSDIQKFEYEIVAPAFNGGILLVDDRNGARASDTNVDAFYSQVLTAAGTQSVVSWDAATQGALTPKRGAGKYSLIIWQSDEDVIRALPQQTQLVGEYLSLSGKLWVTGWRVLQTVSGSNNLANDYSPDNLNRPSNADFLWNYLKIATSNQTALAAFDFSGATGATAANPSITVDPPKSFPPNRTGLPSIEIMTLRSDVPQAEAIYNYVSISGNPDFNGRICGMKYLGTDYKVVVFGFPFYPIKLAEATEAARAILRDLGEI